MTSKTDEGVMGLAELLPKGLTEAGDILTFEGMSTEDDLMTEAAEPAINED